MTGTGRTVLWFSCCLAAATGCVEKLTPPPIPANATSAIDRSEFADVRITLTQTHPPAVAVNGLSSDQLSALAGRDDDATWQEVFALFVGDEAITDRPAILGEYAIEDKALLFRPRYPLVPGLKYRAVYQPAAIDGAVGTDSTVTQVLSIAKPASPPTTVTQVYPSRDVLPENQLKFYLHFSAAMSRGEAYGHIHLLEDSAGEVDYPFLELGEELWDGAGRRFTLFIDPGRIKRGLKPREDLGPSLEAGKSYRLVIDGQWRDAAGNPLAEPFEKSFRVGAPDLAQPDPGAWQLSVPRAGTADALTVDLRESLDHAMLNRVLAATRADGTPVAGAVSVEQQETVWRFQPAAAWQPGEYQIVVDTALEDLAGNNIARPFEVDVVRPISGSVETGTITVPFHVAAP